MAKISYAGSLGLSPAISVHSLLECASQPEIAKNSLKPPYFMGSRSLKVTNVDIPKKLVANAF